MHVNLTPALVTSPATVQRSAACFAVGGCALPAIIHQPAIGAKRWPVGVLFMVGGAQYRVGSHRQFVQWAESLAMAGYAACRFDFRGMGDAEGARLGFDACGEDLAGALAHAIAVTGVPRWVLCGLCDGATVALQQVAHLPEVAGLVLLNPSVSAPALQARAMLREYYWQRLGSLVWWRHLLHGRVHWRRSLADWRGFYAAARLPVSANTLPPLLLALQGIQAPTLWVLSGRDHTAAAFRALLQSDARWQACLDRPGSTLEHRPEADHTFSAPGEHAAVFAAVLEWLTRVA